VDYRKETIPPPVKKITLKNLHVSPRKSHRRSKNPPFNQNSLPEMAEKNAVLVIDVTYESRVFDLELR
jgi:hypothetical protein